MGPTPAPVIAEPSVRPSPPPGVLDLYRALGRAVSEGWGRMAWLPEAALVVAWFAFRTADADRPLMFGWVLAVAVLAVVAPTSGLVVVAATAPFNEGFLFAREIGSKPVLVLLVLLSSGARLAVAGRWRRPPLELVLALAIVAATGAGLLLTRERFGTDFAVAAAQVWFSGIATAMLVFVAAAWAARGGELRPLVAAVASATLAVLLSLADFVDPESFRSGPLAWMTTGEAIATRLTGVMRSPTSTATLVLLPLCVFASAAVLARDRRWRLAAASLSTVLLVAGFVTYSRAVLLALFALAVLIAWRVRRRYGFALLAAGLVVGVLLLPGYMAFRTDAVGARPEPGQVLLANDRQRLNAWATAVRLFADAPLVGQGYRAYRQVAPAFGDSELNAPHNEWLRLFAEHGAFVGLLGLAFVGATAWRLARLRGWLGAGLLGGFASFALAACFNNPFLFNQVTIVAFVMAGTGVALARASPPATSLAPEPATPPSTADR